VPNTTRRSGRRLLEALVDLVAQQGHEATTGAGIGVRAGFSGALIHARYGTKDALLDELMRTEYEQRIVPGLGESVSGLRQAYWDTSTDWVNLRARTLTSRPLQRRGTSGSSASAAPCVDCAAWSGPARRTRAMARAHCPRLRARRRLVAGPRIGLSS
jgi:AcrR family transcriptional regulator